MLYSKKTLTDSNLTIKAITEGKHGFKFLLSVLVFHKEANLYIDPAVMNPDKFITWKKDLPQ